MKKFLKGLALTLAVLVALAYTFNVDYLFKGVAKTYLRGERSATIDDGSLFPGNMVHAGKPKPWPKDSLYNKKPLPANVLKDLKDSETVSLLVVKNGKLLHEEYWNGYSEKTASNSFSMAKTVTVILMITAIQDGRISSVNQKFSDFYQNYANVDFGKDLTLHDLAAMESGLKWKEDYTDPFAPNAKAYYGNSLAEATFLKGFKEKPGTRFEYQSGSTQLLGFAIRKAVNMPMATYLSAKLWTPLGMEANAKWSTDDNNMEKTFCCIHGIPRDFAKLGQLMLDNGKVDSLQIINPEFLRQMTTPTKASNGIYGLGLWINNDNPIPHYYFLGLQGQYIIVIPDQQMVIVRTGSYANQPKNDRGRPDQVRFLVNEIVKNYQ